MDTWVVRPISGQVVGSSNSVTSEQFSTRHGILRGLYYGIATASSGPYVAGTIRYLVCADTSTEFLLPVDTAGAVDSNLFLGVNSNNRYVAFRPSDVPYAPLAQVRVLNSDTANNFTIDGIWLVYQQGVASPG